MRTCATCKQEKDETEFNLRDKVSGTLHRSCKVCSRAHSKKYYEANRQQHIDRNARSRARKVERWNEFKNTLSCCVCGESDPSCLDFHHLDESQKDGDVSDLLHSQKWSVVVEEINKCACLCANCHRKEHAGRLNAPLVKLEITQLCEG